MNKIKILAITLLLCMFALTPVYALGQVWVYPVNNTTGDYSSTVLDTTHELAPGYHKILGVCVVPYDTTKHSELVVGLYDNVPGIKGGVIAECIAEAEALEASNSFSWFPYPLSITTKLIVNQGANTTVYVYYAR